MRRVSGRYSVLLLVYMVIMVTIGVSSYLLITAVTNEMRTSARTNELTGIADDLSIASNSLANTARQYARFGEPEDLEKYITLLNHHGGGGESLVTRARNSGASDQQIGMLEHARGLHNILGTSEARALRLLVMGWPETSITLPAAISEATLTPSLLTAPPEAKVRAARTILNARIYDEELRRVQYSVQDFYRSILHGAERESRRSRIRMAIAMLLLVIALLFIPFVYHLDRTRRQTAEKRVKALMALGDQLNAAKTVEESAQLIMDAAQSLVGWDACFLDLCVPNKDTMKPVLCYDTMDGQKQRVPYSSALTRRVVLEQVCQHGPRLILRRYEDMAKITGGTFGSNRRSASLIFAPINKDHRIIGILSVQSYTVNAYSKRDLEDVTWLADRCAASLERADLHDALRLSEERYRALLENNLDGVFLVSARKMLYCNDAYARTFGYESAEALIGIDIAKLVGRNQRSLVAVLSRGRFDFIGKPLLITAIRRDKTLFKCEVIGRPIEYEGHTAVLGTLRDVSERERAAEELDRVHEAYRRAIEALSAAPYILDSRTGQYNFLGANIKSLTGFDADELTQSVYNSRVVQAELQGQYGDLPFDEVVQRAAEGDFDRIRIDVLFEQADGKHVWLADASIPHRDELGNHIGSFGILMDITERKQAEERAKAFADLGAKLSGVTSAQSAARVVAETADTLFGYDACNVNLYDADSEVLTDIYTQDLVDGERCEVQRVIEKRLLSPILQAALERGPQLILRKTLLDGTPGLVPFGNKGPSASMMFAAMRSGDRPIGFLSFHSYKFDAYNHDNLRDLQYLAQHCTAGLLRANLYEELDRNEEQFRAVWEHAGSGMRLTDEHGTVRMVNPAFCRLIGIPQEQFEGKTFTVMFADEVREKSLERYCTRFAERSVEHVLERTLKLWDGREITVRVSNAFLATPHGVMLLGVFSDLTAERKLEHELRRNAAELERLATMDPLTNLFNRREFMRRFSVEVVRAQRYGSAISLMMIDADHFKRVNDVHGHLAGDRVLSRLGELILESTRFTDIPCRYGGEEFCVCMPETQLDGAIAFAERLRVRLGEETFKGANDETFRVTCSIGVVELTKAVRNPGEFLAIADAALYRAKDGGRDRVSV